MSTVSIVHRLEMEAWTSVRAPLKCLHVLNVELGESPLGEVREQLESAERFIVGDRPRRSGLASSCDANFPPYTTTPDAIRRLIG